MALKLFLLLKKASRRTCHNGYGQQLWRRFYCNNTVTRRCNIVRIRLNTCLTKTFDKLTTVVIAECCMGGSLTVVHVVVTYLTGSLSSYPFLTCFTVCSVWYVLFTVRLDTVCVYSDLSMVRAPFLWTVTWDTPGASLLYKLETYRRIDFLSGRSRTTSEDWQYDWVNKNQVFLHRLRFSKDDNTHPVL